ncbi:peptide chain release factor-like protein [compost metagenome]
MDTRSQLQNKKLAKERLALKLMQLQNHSAQQDSDKQWQNHAEIQRGNPTRVFKGINFKF